MKDAPGPGRRSELRVLRSPWRSLRPYPEEPAWADLRRGAEHFPDKIALIDAAGTRSTYRDLWEGARRVAALLQREANLANDIEGDLHSGHTDLHFRRF